MKCQFEDLVDQYQRDVYRLAYHLTSHHHDAEDLTQEVFIKVHRSLDTFRGEASLKSWMFKITVNTYLNKRRKKALAFMRLKEDIDPVATDPRSSPDHASQSQSLREVVDRAMERLSPRERTAFAMRHYNGCTINEVALALEVAEGTVKSLLYRALKKLRKELSSLHEEGSL